MMHSFAKRSRMRRGYTIVEVMMALAVLAIGAAAIIAMQKVAVAGTLGSRHVTSGANVASMVLDRMQAEATGWNDRLNADASDPAASAEMPTLGPALDAAMTLPNNPSWVAFENGGLPIATAGLTLTGDIPNDGDADPSNDSAYCTHVRATILGDTTGSLAPPVDAADLARIEVRTFWARSGRSVASECAYANFATFNQWLNDAVPTIAFDGVNPRSRHEYGFVFMTTTVRRNTR